MYVSPTTTYSINEIFLSTQGEGARTGTVNVFVRFAGCDLTCDGPSNLSPYVPQCDTNFSGGRKLKAHELVHQIKQVGGACRWVICTGGEPLLQLDATLIAMLHAAGYKIAIETNGNHPIPEGVDWVCVSPKMAEHTLRAQRADELKYVIHDGQALPKPRIRCERKFVSPAFTPEGPDWANIKWAIQLVKEHPEWSLSIQVHKFLNVR